MFGLQQRRPLASTMYVRQLILIVLITGLTAFNGFAQTKTFTTYQQIWMAYFNQTRFHDRWGIWADAHLRTKDDFVDSLSTGILRLGLTYYIRDQVKATAGIGYINHFPGDNHRDISQPEIRPWQQLQWHTGTQRTKVMQYLRLEERFRRKVASDDALAEGYNFNFRVRYNYLVQWAIGSRPYQPRSFSVVLNDELHINFGDQIVYNYFDQNRFFVGANYFFQAQAYLQFGYLYVFQQTASGNSYRNIHGARLSFFQNLDLRKKPG